MNNLLNSLISWWSKVIQKLGGRVVASLITAMIMTLIAVAFTDGWIVAVGKEDSRLKLLNENSRYIATLRANLYQAESAQRGYLLTGKASYAAPFQRSVDAARGNITNLRNNFNNKLISEVSSPHAVLLDQITANVEARVTEMAMTIELVKSGKQDDASQVINLDHGLSQAQKFNEMTNQLSNLQLDMLTKMRSKRNNYILLSRISLIGTAVALSLLVMLVIRQLTNEILHRDRLSRDLAIERVSLQAKLDERTGLLETLAVDYQYDVERERRQLARELHDELGSILTATKMDLSWVIRKFKDIAPEATQKLVKTMRYLDQGIQFKRRIVEALHPSILTTFGFWAAMKNFVESAAERNEWELQLILPDDSTQISEAMGLIAYRIVQETLNNATKYAKANKVSVHIMVDFKFLKLEIEDDGVGMDMNAMNTETHGLTGMRHRVQAIGGQFDIISKPGEGVFTRALLPLESKVVANIVGEQDIKIKTPIPDHSATGDS